MSQEKSQLNRFVVLYHNVPEPFEHTSGQPLIGSERGSHWDLMLDWEGSLLAWALDAEPFVQSTSAAILLPPHRLDFLTYEGPLSGNRGTVVRIMSGLYRILPSGSTEIRLPESISAGCLMLELSWADSLGRIIFQQKKDDQWSLTFLVSPDNCQQ